MGIEVVINVDIGQGMFFNFIFYCGKATNTIVFYSNLPNCHPYVLEG